MQDYRLADITVGLTHTFEVDVTAEMLNRFADLSGDRNPLHVDAEFARASGFHDRVAYGMLTASFYSTLVGMYLPGRRALLQGVDASFVAPVFPGDHLTVVGEVIAVHPSVRQIEIKAHVSNQHGKKVSRAKIRSSVND